MTEENVQLLGTNEEGYEIYSEFDAVGYDKQVTTIDEAHRDKLRELYEKLNPAINQKAMLEDAVKRHGILASQINHLRSVIIELVKHQAFKTTSPFDVNIDPSDFTEEHLADAYPERREFTSYFAMKDGKRHEVKVLNKGKLEVDK